MKNRNLAKALTNHFAYPSYFANTTNDIDKINNTDTIYNFLLLAILNKNNNYMVDEDVQLFINELNKEIENRAKQIIKSDFKYIGFYTYVSNIAYSCILAKKLKEIKPKLKIFWQHINCL